MNMTSQAESEVRWTPVRRNQVSTLVGGTNTTTKTVGEMYAELLYESDKQFTCLICSETLHMPATISCGHTFCKSCIEDWLATRENCPCCRQSIPLGSSESVDVFVDYLIRVKPLLHNRTLHLDDEDGDENDNGAIVPEEENAVIGMVTPGQNETLLKSIGEHLASIDCTKDRHLLESALWLVRTMIASGEPYDELLTDLRSTPDFRNVISKYYRLRQTADLKEYDYVPVNRTKEYYLGIPSASNVFCLFGMFTLTTLLCCLFAHVEETIYEDLQQSLLRVLGVLSFYLNIFQDLYEHA